MLTNFKKIEKGKKLRNWNSPVRNNLKIAGKFVKNQRILKFDIVQGLLV